MLASQIHIDRLRLRHLRLLELIDRHQSLRAVAETLNLTQPAVSQMVKDLEFAFGIALVDRSVKGALLTDAGRHALQRARTGLATFDHLADELLAEPPTLIRIGTNPAVTYQLLPEALRELGLAQSGLRFTVVAGMVDDMMRGLLDGRFDCYVGRATWDHLPQSMAELITATPLIETELTLACSADHPLAGREAIDPADLLDWPWVLPAPDTNNRMSLEAGFRNCGLTPPRPTVEMSADPNALMALALRGEVLTCVPRMALRGFGSSGLLVPVNVPRLRLLPVLTSFLTLAENDALPPLRMLKEAFVRAVRQAGATRNQLPLV